MNSYYSALCLPFLQYSTKVTQILDIKKRLGWVQDSQKRKLAVAKDSFFPVPLGRNRKEIATQWFQDLAGSKPLSTLVVRKVRKVVPKQIASLPGSSVVDTLLFFGCRGDQEQGHRTYIQ